MEEDKKIKVSILCTAYNHEVYIRDALEGFVNQKTNFNYEIILHDDASNDNTPKIISEYEQKYPKIIKVVYQNENQYSKGNQPSKILFSMAKGQYIAFCEGDDYWTDNRKLQKQYDILENNKNINMCAHSVKQIDAKTGKKVGMLSAINKNGIIPIEDVIKNGGGYLGTCSLFFRKSIFDNDYKFKNIITLDYVWQILGSIPKGLYFINECMANYRVLSNGSWTEKQKKNKNRANQINLIIIKMLKQFNEDTKGDYISAVQYAIDDNNFWISYRNADLVKLKNNEFKNMYKKLNILRKLKLYYNYYFR